VQVHKPHRAGEPGDSSRDAVGNGSSAVSRRLELADGFDIPLGQLIESLCATFVVRAMADGGPVIRLRNSPGLVWHTAMQLSELC
jgi:hypothetical protein